MTRPRESWLRSEDDVKWAAAVARCEHPATYCGSDGFCHYGTCFAARDAPDLALEQRVQRLEDQVRLLRRALAQERAFRRAAQVAAREGRA
jgi:hypothetical protein